MCQDFFEFNQGKNTRLGMLIMCGASKEFVEFIKQSWCSRNTKIQAHSTAQLFS